MSRVENSRTSGVTSYFTTGRWWAEEIAKRPTSVERDFRWGRGEQGRKLWFSVLNPRYYLLYVMCVFCLENKLGMVVRDEPGEAQGPRKRVLTLWWLRDWGLQGWLLALGVVWSVWSVRVCALPAPLCTLPSPLALWIVQEAGGLGDTPHQPAEVRGPLHSTARQAWPAQGHPLALALGPRLSPWSPQTLPSLF